MAGPPPPPTPPPTPAPGPSNPPSTVSTSPPSPAEVAQQQIETQVDLEAETGLKIRGILGGLPVAEQTQEYFAVFEEAGDTGPEIIDKTQFRITYLVDSDLGTSKPSADSDTAINMTQNFERGRTCVVRADNATVLNQNLTGKQEIYNVGSVALIATTETGSSPQAYNTTMSFSDPRGQDIVSDAEDVSCLFTAGNPNTPLGTGEDTLMSYPNAIKPISGSDFLSIGPGTDGIFNTITWNANTTEAGTRVVVQGNAFIQNGNESPTMGVTGKVTLEFDDGGTGNFFALDTHHFAISPGDTTYHYPDVYSAPFFKNYVIGSKFRIRVSRTGLSSNTIRIRGGNFRVRQEYLPGEVVIEGLNATFAPYWENQYTNYDPPTGSGYSVLTASAGFSYFINSNFRAKLSPESAAFDPKGDTVTFSPIITDLNMTPGDEIRFEYNKNKVHTVTNVTEFENGTIAITLSPQISTGSNVDHFTYYRIQQDGGYVLINTEKNNTVAGEQPFSGIILPEYPTEDLKNKSDQLIYQLKEANIIEK